MDLYPELEPHEQGILQVDDRDSIYWETCGNPNGKPAVVLHGGPGSGCLPWHRRLFDPGAYRLVLFDQRGCGRSRPHASEPHTELGNNNTASLISDIEMLRDRLQIERWLVWGGSWGSTLALAYAEMHPDRVSQLILWGVTTGRRCEFDWLFRGGVAIFFPEQWDRLCATVPAVESGDIVDAYHRLLMQPDPSIHQPAAEAWCRWESATVDWPPTGRLSPRFADREFALAFARLVTHYVRHNAWLEDGALHRGAISLKEIPGIMVNGRYDFQAPIANAWEMQRVWPKAELVIVDNAGHSPDRPEPIYELIRASNRFAET
ncbi:MAG: prolyl aminopeptidase [Actinomycetota bacterium]|nr:prolyl aminopeptidase [Actinomycetota bacterium]